MVWYVEEGDESAQCIEVPCTVSGRLPGDTVIIGSQISVSPTDLDMSAVLTYSNQEECETVSSDEDRGITITCNEQTDVAFQG